MSTAGDDPLVFARALPAWYGSSRVLHGVDFAVGRGETVALLGRNGMGKTTTVRSIFGLVRPRAGRIVFDGTTEELRANAYIRKEWLEV